MNTWIKLFFSLMTVFFSTLSFAQDKAKPEMADGLKANGMIYVVVIVLLIVFAGIIIYLISIDRKLNRIEKELKK